MPRVGTFWRYVSGTDSFESKMEMLLGTRYFSGVEGIFQDQHGSPFFDQGEMRGFEPVELKKYPEAHRVHAVAPAVVAGPPLSTMMKLCG